MKTFARWLLAGSMVFAGASHLWWGRKEFQAQVPDWITDTTGLDKDAVVVASGAVEVMLGAALVTLPKDRRRVGAILAAFFVAVFPGNIAQYVEGTDAFGLDTDQKRLVRLFFQPVLVALALWGGGWLGRSDASTASMSYSNISAGRCTASRCWSPCSARSQARSAAVARTSSSL